MIQLLIIAAIISGSSYSIPDFLYKNYKPSYKILVTKPLVLNQYVSPTLNLDPWKEYRDKKNQEILDQIFLKELKEQTGK